MCSTSRIFSLWGLFYLQLDPSTHTEAYSSVSAAQHEDLESLCSRISLSMHQNAMLLLYMLLHCKWFNNYAVCWCCLNNQRSTCTMIGVGFEFGVCEVENTTAVNCYKPQNFNPAVLKWTAGDLWVLMSHLLWFTKPNNSSVQTCVFPSAWLGLRSTI